MESVEAKETTNEQMREYDDFFQYLSSFGRYQKIVFFSLHMLLLPIGMQFDSLIFAFSPPHFHCITPNVTCEVQKCCDGCNEYQFDGPYHSTVSEWNLICDRAYLGATIQSCFFAGMFFGSFITGIVSDKWGRKKCLFGCNLFILIAGIAGCFVDCISFLAFLRFVVGFFLPGVMLTLFIYSMEFVGPSYRTGVGNYHIVIYAVFSLLSTFFAYFIRDWRWFVFLASTPLILLFPFWKVFPESPRWLIANNHLDEAQVVLMKYGGKDNQPVDEDKLRDLIQDVRRQELARMAQEKAYSPLDLVRTRKMRKWSFIVNFQWLVVGMINFGMMLFVAQFAGNPYLNFAIMNTAGALKIIITYTAFLKLGRRITQGVFIFITGVVLLSILGSYKEYPTVTAVLGLMGYITGDCNWIGVYLITSEIFPTVVRNTAQGVGSATGRLGGMIAPYISMMSQLPGLGLAFPVVVFGVLAVIAGILMYWLRETLNSPLYQTIAEAESAKEDFSIPCCGKKALPSSDEETKAALY